jgi:hypothetical protein
MVRVTRPLAVRVTRYPFVPTDVLMPRVLTVIRTPGMTLKLLRIRKPIGQSWSIVAGPVSRYDYSTGGDEAFAAHHCYKSPRAAAIERS